MNSLDSKRLGFALGTSFALVYLGSIFIMHTVPKEEAIWFFNSIAHGVDVTSVLRWEQVYKMEGRLVTSGIYTHMRHPQYTGIFIITFGFMIQWPTVTTLILWPFVLRMYNRLARREEEDVMAKFPEEYRAYMKRTPMSIPRLSAGRLVEAPPAA